MTDIPEALVEKWELVRQSLATDPSVSPFHKGFISLLRPKALLGDTLLLSAPNESTRKKVEEESLKTSLADAVRRIIGAVTPHIIIEPLADGLSDPEEAVSPEAAGEEALPEAPAEPPPSWGHQELPSLDGPPPRIPAERTGIPSGEMVEKPASGKARPTRKATSQDLSTASGIPPTAAPRQGTAGEAPSGLNPKYTFDNFVTGNSNRFAAAAALAVAEQPGKAYNPLFIYGDSGLGKTHLLHALGHHALRLYKEREVKVLYVTSEDFTNAFINSIGSNGAKKEFKDRYRNVDILMIDDIQFLASKGGTQEEFFHTFNTLLGGSKQVVITSDVPPKKLSSFEDRLRTRFEMGLITDVQPPNLETRIAVLRRKAASDGIVVPPDVLELIASKVSANIRELEGALIRVTAYAQLYNQDVDLKLAQTVMKDLVSHEEDQNISPEVIMEHTAAFYHLGLEDLMGNSRVRKIVTARQIAMYLCRELTDLSLPNIGGKFGGRDHTTVHHAVKKIKEQMSEQHKVYNQITELTNRIKQRNSAL